MNPNQIPLAIADHIVATASRLAEIIDLDKPYSLARSNDLRAAFIMEAMDPRETLVDLVLNEVELKMNRPESYDIVDIDRRPFQVESVEIVADRIVDVVQTLDAVRYTRDRITTYIAIELAGLWLPRLDGMRECTGLTGTQYRPLSDLPPANSHMILVKTGERQIHPCVVDNGVVIGGPEPMPETATWMYVPE